MTWVNADVRFVARGAILTLDRRCSMGQAIIDLLRKETNPDQIEDWLRGVIYDSRPDLTGCTIIAMNFNAQRYRWEFFVEHPSLPAMLPGSFLEEQPIFRETGELPGRGDPDATT